MQCGKETTSLTAQSPLLLPYLLDNSLSPTIVLHSLLRINMFVNLFSLKSSFFFHFIIGLFSEMKHLLPFSLIYSSEEAA